MTVPLKRVQAHTRYTLADGTPVPGVTTVLGVLAKPALVKWANRLGLDGIDVDRYVDKLANIGTLAHYLIECHIAATEPDLEPYSPEELALATNALQSYYAWHAATRPEYVASELRLVSEKHKFGGTCDGIAWIGGTLTLVDYKTSKALYPEHAMQVAAYVQLARENRYPVVAARIVRIGRTPDEGFEERVYPAKDLKQYWEVFRRCLEIHELRREWK